MRKSLIPGRVIWYLDRNAKPCGKIHNAVLKAVFEDPVISAPVCYTLGGRGVIESDCFMTKRSAAFAHIRYLKKMIRDLEVKHRKELRAPQRVLAALTARYKPGDDDAE